MNKNTIRKGVNAVASNDSDVKHALSQVGYPDDRKWPDGFETFVSIIVSQQLSTKAANAILLRINKLLPELTPENLLSKRRSTLRKAGLSERKVDYLRSLSLAINRNEFNPNALKKMDDDQAIKSISSLHGLGEWSAEVYLIFALGRRDIFPAKDLALQVALQKLKKLDTKPTPGSARNMVAHWMPNRSFGSLFLWRYYQHTKNSGFSL